MEKIKLLLFGGSLTHAYFIQQITPKLLKGLDISLISPHSIIYHPEMIGSFFEGAYSIREIGINLQQLCWYRNIRFIEGKVLQIDPHQKQLLLEDGRSLAYDLLSIDLDHSGQAIEGVNQFAVSIYDGHHAELVKKVLGSGIIDPRITIVGASFLGVETALAIKQMFKNRESKASITLIDAAQTILPGCDLKLKESVLYELKQKRVEVLLGKKIIRISGDLLTFQDNTILDYGFLIWSASNAVNPIAKDSGLAVDEKGRLRVNQYLQMVNNSVIFGCGQNIIIEGVDIPEYTHQYFSQAQLILKNIQQLIRERNFKTFRPNRKEIIILNIGNQRAIIQQGAKVLKGKQPWRKKQKMNQKLLRSFKK